MFGSENVAKIVAVPRRMRLAQGDRLTHRREQATTATSGYAIAGRRGPNSARAGGQMEDHQQQDDGEPDLASQSSRRRRRNEASATHCIKSHYHTHTRITIASESSAAGRAAWAFGSTWRRMGGDRRRGHAIRARVAQCSASSPHVDNWRIAD